MRLRKVSVEPSFEIKAEDFDWVEVEGIGWSLLTLLVEIFDNVGSFVTWSLIDSLCSFCS